VTTVGSTDHTAGGFLWWHLDQGRVILGGKPWCCVIGRVLGFGQPGVLGPWGHGRAGVPCRVAETAGEGTGNASTSLDLPPGLVDVLEELEHVLGLGGVGGIGRLAPSGWP
jgi:hypothetical protein